MQIEQGTLRIHLAAEQRVFLPLQRGVAPALAWIAAPMPANCEKAAGTQSADLPDTARTDAVLRGIKRGPAEGSDAFLSEVLAGPF